MHIPAKPWRRDLYLAAGLLAAAAVLWGIFSLKHKQPAVLLEISVDGQVVKELDLETDTQITIPGAGGGSNTLVIEDGFAWVSEATCPDKVCIHQGKISLSGEMVVCLPNKMIAKITS